MSMKDVTIYVFIIYNYITNIDIYLFMNFRDKLPRKDSFPQKYLMNLTDLYWSSIAE